MENKCIKNVDKETWREFKALSVKNNMKMSVLLKNMVKNYKKKSKKDDKKFWDEILNHKKILSDEEAKDIEDIVMKSRNERGFRDVSF